MNTPENTSGALDLGALSENVPDGFSFLGGPVSEPSPVEPVFDGLSPSASFYESTPVSPAASEIPPPPGYNSWPEAIAASNTRHSASTAVEESDEPRVVVSKVAQQKAATQDASSSGNNAEFDDSLIWDSPQYCRDTLTFGTVVIRLREVSEQTRYRIGTIGDDVEKATSGRITTELVGLMLSGLQGATEAQKQSIRRINAEDAVAFRDFLAGITEKVICEGIVSWETTKEGAVMRELTDDVKLGMGEEVRKQCLERILQLSGFGERQQGFLSASSP